MKRQYLLGSIIVSALLVPVLASAQSADDIRAQIQSLLSQITALQQQLSGLTSNTSTTISTSSNSCPNLYRALSRGSRGSDVISLQQFLIAQGLLSSDSATGFFGSMTEAAVQRWQAQNSIVAYGDANTTGYGVIGARTRAAIVARCGMTPPPVVQSCQQYQMPICSTGQHVETGATGPNGCVGAPRCVNNTVSCPIYNACPTGYTGNTSTDEKGCTVRQCVPPTIPPTPITESNISFTAERASEINPDTYSFYATLPAGTSYSEYSNYSIDFGDGKKEQGSGCIDWCSGPSWHHRYQTPGTYVARLMGRDGNTIKSVTVTPRKTTYPTASVNAVDDTQSLTLDHNNLIISGTAANTATIRIVIKGDSTFATFFDSGFFDVASGAWTITPTLPVGFYSVVIYAPGDSNTAIGTAHLSIR